MRLALLLAACACVAAPPPAQAGGIGQAVGQFVCNTIPIRTFVLESLGLRPFVYTALGGEMRNGHTVEATVIDPGKTGSSFRQGDPVIIRVIDATACRFSVEPAASGPRAPASGGKGTARTAAQIAARSGPPGLEAELPPGALEFQVDREGRPVPIRR